MSSTSVRAFQPPAEEMHALRHTPPVPLKLKKLPKKRREVRRQPECRTRRRTASTRDRNFF